MTILEEVFMWLGVWLLVANLLVLLLFLYLRRMSKKRFLYIMFVLHHWLQNFDKGYDYEEVKRDLAKVDEV